MKIGTAVKLSAMDYPQYRGYVGILMDEPEVDQWKVYIDGKVHPYHVHRASMLKAKVINASG